MQYLKRFMHQKGIKRKRIIKNSYKESWKPSRSLILTEKAYSKDSLIKWIRLEVNMIQVSYRILQCKDRKTKFWRRIMSLNMELLMKWLCRINKSHILGTQLKMLKILPTHFSIVSWRVTIKKPILSNNKTGRYLIHSHSLNP